MTETQKRINAYKKALPHMKERVTATLLLLAISVAMMTSATFAWMTLSRNPEISSIATTVTTNGNLEIALSDKDGLQPDDTAVGDGGRDVTLTNLTWGNLINLSSQSYGLDFLTLRPASLNPASLISSPLYAVEYAEDGRVLGYFTDFAFSNYDPVLGTFGVPSTGVQYGVRAVSSVTYKDAAGETFFKNQMQEINKNSANAKNIFNSIIGNDTYMSAISALVGIHVSVSLDDTDISCVQYIDSLVAMITEFQASVDAVGQTMVDIANLHLYINEYRTSPELYAENKHELADLKENNYSNAFVTKYKSVIAGLDAYITLAKKTDKAYSGIIAAKQTHTQTGNVYWKADLEFPANQLCNMSTATLDSKTVSQLSADISGAVGLLFDGKVHQARINGGALKDLDQMLGEPTMVVEDIPISVKVPKKYGNTTIPIFGGTTQTLVVDVTTAASGSGSFVLPEDVKDAEAVISTAAGSSYKGQAIAADTYAMAIDFWVRTNEKNTLLILEGEYQYREDKVPVYGTDASGLEVPLYTYTETVDGEAVNYDVYKVETTDENGDKVTTWYFAADHSELTADRLAGVTPSAQEQIIKTVIGYEGVNRVWDELDDPNSNASQQIPQDGISTTQGSGSCYIFYPESPEDQERCLELLASMRVAFVDAEGKLLGEAGMDTANAIEDAGRILVPLQMRPQAPIVMGTDSKGDEIISTDYVTCLAQNEATRITALVYLDGANLTNSDVLSAGSINGQLNIQFGTSDLKMEPMENQDVMREYYTLSWHDSSWVTTSWNTNNTAADAWKIGNQLHSNSYIPEGCVINLKLLVEGTQPATIKGNFISYISSTQGTREKVFTMKKNEDGFWVAGMEDEDGNWTEGVPLSGPGNYKLRSLQIDGVDIPLGEDQCINVEIEGIKINSLTCHGWSSGDGSTMSLMTAQTVYQQPMTMTLSTNQGEIPAIQAVFLGDNGKTVTANFTKVGDSYMGTANFTASGTYKLTYVIVDGVYTPVSETLYKTLSIRLGLRANLVITQPVNQAYLDLEEALAAATTEEEKANIQAQMEAVLQKLHYGTGIEGDENENGLQLQQTNGNWSMVHDGEAMLFMDVSCTIVDDQGIELKNLGNVELFYTAGSETNRLTSGVKWNSTTNRYEGTFQLQKNFGMYRFEMVTINGTDNTITAASTAPSITSIAPTPMSVVQRDPYEDLVYDLSGGTKREMYITLQDAPAAQLVVTLTKGTGDSATTVTKAINSYASEEAYGDSVRYTFAIPLDSDGYWNLESAKVCNVFYDGMFYAGGDDASGWLDLDLDGDKTMDELVKDGETDTYYLTEVEVYANRIPDSKTHDFMTSNACNNMYITVQNQGRPLADVLAELAADDKYSKYNIDPTVSVSQTYTWTEKISNWTVDDESKLPTRNFGGTLAMNTTEGASYGQYALGNMNFLVDGKYVADFTLVIGDTVYNSRDEMLEAGIQLTGKAEQLETPVTVQWNTPVLKITAVTNATKDSLNNTKFSVNIKNDSDMWQNEAVSGVQNYYEDYYANVYIMGELGSYSVPSVSMQLTYAGSTGAVDVAIGGSEFSTTYTFSGNNATVAKEIGAASTTAGLGFRDRAGTTTVRKVNLSYGGGSYEFTLANPVTIKQDANPKYLTLSADLTQVDMPSTISATASNGGTFSVSTGGASTVRIISPDGREFSVTLPKLTRVVTGRYEDDPNTVVTYDNENGTAVADYVYYHWTTETGGCNSTTVHHYEQYQRYERTATKIGQRYHYEDTYTMNTWSGGAAGTSVKVSATTTFTAGTVNVTSKLVRTEELKGSVTEYRYQAVSGNGDMNAMNPNGTAYDDESRIVTAWTEVAS